MKDKTVEQIEQDAELLHALIEKFVPDGERKDALIEMFSSDVGMSFFTAPASSKEEYHNSYQGGLFDHSINVLMNLQKLNEAMQLGYSDEEIFISAILHDFGKAISADLKTPFYIPAEEWKQKKGQRFDHAQQPYMVTRDRTMFVLQHFGVKLSIAEYQAIMLNDGYILEGNRSYCMKEEPLAFWLLVSDHWSAKREKMDHDLLCTKTEG